MLTTQQVIDAIRTSNPRFEISEDRIRHAIRRGDVPRPSVFAGRFIWMPRDVASLARALGLNAPDLCQEHQPAA